SCPLLPTLLERLPDASAPNRQLVGHDPQLALGREPAFALRPLVDTGPLKNRRGTHLETVQESVEALEEDLVFLELNLAQPPGSTRPLPWRWRMVSPRGRRPAGLYGQARRRGRASARPPQWWRLPIAPGLLRRLPGWALRRTHPRTS